MEDGTLWDRIRSEIGHWRRRDWTLAEVGAHWDATEDYDDINSETYSYFRRFIDGLRLSNAPNGTNIPDRPRVLDLCARTGNGTTYFFQNGRVGSAICADVSMQMGRICVQRLKEAGLKRFLWVPVLEESLPFVEEAFDLILCFETVEHLPRPEQLVSELGRVARPGAILVLTTPNVLWEPVHALAAITQYHHSEGPHRFIRHRRLERMIQAAGFEIERQETTVLVPGGPKSLVRWGEKIEAATVHTLMPALGLRRIFIGRKL